MKLRQLIESLRQLMAEPAWTVPDIAGMMHKQEDGAGTVGATTTANVGAYPARFPGMLRAPDLTGGAVLPKKRRRKSA
jgi:hypothetical protein